MTLPHVYRRSSPDSPAICYVWFAAMHTRVDMAFTGREAESCFLALAERAKALIETLTRVANCHDPSSELSVAQNAAAYRAVALSPTLAAILHEAIRLNEATLGLFDISIDSSPYAPGTLREVSIEDDKLRFGREGIRLNLSGFLKGYALDCLRPLFAEAADVSALVSMGGSSVMAYGSPEGTTSWPVSLRANSATTIALGDGECLTTSGNDSPQRVHIRHPRTGVLIKGERQTSVVTRSGALGEALSTALFLSTAHERAQLLHHFPSTRLITAETS